MLNRHALLVAAALLATGCSAAPSPAAVAPATMTIAAMAPAPAAPQADYELQGLGKWLKKKAKSAGNAISDGAKAAMSGAAYVAADAAICGYELSTGKELGDSVLCDTTKDDK
jgi:hypothetical protein